MSNTYKPHIEYVAEFHTWMCSSGEAPGGFRVGYGDSAVASYLDWSIKSLEVRLHNSEPMDLGIQKGELWDLYGE